MATSQVKERIYYHDLSKQLRDYLRQEGTAQGIVLLLTAVSCSFQDVLKEESLSEAEKQTKEMLERTKDASSK